MLWLLVIALSVTLAVLSFTTGVTFVVVRERRRQRREHAARGMESGGLPDQDGPEEPADPFDVGELAELDPAVDFVQIWLDNEWKQRFG